MRMSVSRISGQHPGSEIGFEETFSPSGDKSGIFITVALHQRRIKILSVIISVVIVGLIVRLVDLQGVRGNEFRALSDQNRIRRSVHFARRGIVTDRFGTALVQNTPSFILTAAPPQLPAAGEPRQSLMGNLSRTLGIASDELQLLQSPEIATVREVSLGIVLDYNQALQFELNKEQFPGIELQVFSTRSYPRKISSLSHLLGFVGPTSGDDVKRNPSLQPLSFVGKSGLELEYDDQLRGIDGATLWEYDSQGIRGRILSEIPSADAASMRTTLSLPLQALAEQSLSDVLRQSGTTNGTVIVMNARTGELLTLVSLPSFDPEIFSSPHRAQDRKKILTDPKKPLFFRALSGQYPSGSTIKPFIALTALQNGIIDRSTGVQSVGGIRIGEFYFPDWKAGGHGWTTVTKALAQSVNTFFYLLVGGDVGSGTGWSRSALGMERFTQGLQQFGWGSTTGVDLPGEASGFVPSPQWKREATGTRWFIGDTYHAAIGQGDILVTPLQLAVATARLVSNNKNLIPWLVRDPALKRAPIASESQINLVKEGMRLAVTEGSARRLTAIPLPISAKTGTAQSGGTQPPHSWLISFADVYSVPIVVTAMIEHGGEGSGSALTVASSIYQLLSQKPELIQ
ncbi:hypothetical protein HZA86_02445 [Candidatus Uhrbacteria bacterium]|nr:hypothetical protein [Candidatus Uhrbacteria bacterium]